MIHLLLDNLNTFKKYFKKNYEQKVNHFPFLSSQVPPPGGAPAPLLTVSCFRKNL